MEFENMKNIDIKAVDKTRLEDIDKIKIDRDAEREKRLADYLEQIKNPYCFMCAGYAVKLSFAENGRSLEECFSEAVRVLL